MDGTLKLHDPETCEQCQRLKRAVEQGDPLITCIHATGRVCELCLNGRPG
jgi:hypothetical protein